MKPGDFDIQHEAASFNERVEAWQTKRLVWEENFNNQAVLADRDKQLATRRHELEDKAFAAKESLVHDTHDPVDASRIIFLGPEEDTELGRARLAAYIRASDSGCWAEKSAGVQFVLVHSAELNLKDSQKNVDMYYTMNYRDLEDDRVALKDLAGNYVGGLRLRSEDTSGIGGRALDYHTLTKQQLDLDEATLTSIEESINWVLAAANDPILNPVTQNA